MEFAHPKNMRFKVVGVLYIWQPAGLSPKGDFRPLLCRKSEKVRNSAEVTTYTPCIKKVPTFKLSVTLSNLYDTSIPWEIKKSNFCRYLADMEENAKVLHSSRL